MDVTFFEVKYSKPDVKGLKNFDVSSGSSRRPLQVTRVNVLQEGDEWRTYNGFCFGVEC